MYGSSVISRGLCYTSAGSEQGHTANPASRHSYRTHRPFRGGDVRWTGREVEVAVVAKGVVSATRETAGRGAHV